MTADDPLGLSLIHHFSLSNAEDEPADDLPTLLRSVADTLETIDGAVPLDLVLHDDGGDDGAAYSVVVYYELPED